MYRITTIVSRLNIGERLFLNDLAEEFGVSLRTIQKDFATRLSVFPVVRNSDGSYSFIKGYRLKGSSNPEEGIVIELMNALVEQVNTDYSEVSRRILSGAAYANRTFTIALRFEDISAHLDTFYLLKQTIHFRQKIQFQYTTKHGNKLGYLADPYRLGLNGQLRNNHGVVIGRAFRPVLAPGAKLACLGLGFYVNVLNTLPDMSGFLQQTS